MNISQAGGGPDLASKAQILAYYELVLADLKVTLINFNIANVINLTTYLPHVSYPVINVILTFYQCSNQLKLLINSPLEPPRITHQNTDDGRPGKVQDTGHREADLVASLRAQGQRQTRLTHPTRQRNAGDRESESGQMVLKKERK